MAWPGLVWSFIRATFCSPPEIIDAIVILSDQSTFIGRGRSESWLLCVAFLNCASRLPISAGSFRTELVFERVEGAFDRLDL